MSIYMTETEQLEAIKAWWQRHQRWITLLVTSVLLVVAGYRYWHWHTDKIAHQASEAYEQLMIASANQEGEAIEAYAKSIFKAYGRTVYADASRLALAKYWVSQEKWQAAVDLLEQVSASAKMPALRQVAHIRLARLWLSEKAYDKALNLLENTEKGFYQPLVDELKGDIYAETGRKQAAETCYRAAHEAMKLRGISNAFLEMKFIEAR